MIRLRLASALLASCLMSFAVASCTTSTEEAHSQAASGGNQYADVTTRDTFYNEIRKVTSKGIMEGCGGGRFCPNEKVTREQMAQFIERALGQTNPPAPLAQTFKDVPKSRKAYAFIEDAAKRGFVRGCGNGNFCPDDAITREQMAEIIISALGEPDPPVPANQRFTDVPPSSKAYTFVDRMAARNITLGCGGGNYCPAQPVTREQMAAFLSRAFNL